MATVINYGATLVTPGANSATGIPFPYPVGAAIATTSVNLDPANPASFNNARVELKANIGVQGTLGVPKIKVSILKFGVEIYNAVVGVETNLESNALISVLALDGNSHLGILNYTLALENLTPGTTFSVIGPVVFTATAIGG